MADTLLNQAWERRNQFAEKSSIPLKEDRTYILCGMVTYHRLIRELGELPSHHPHTLAVSMQGTTTLHLYGSVVIPMVKEVEGEFEFIETNEPIKFK